LPNAEIPANSKLQAGKKKYCNRGLDSGSSTLIGAEPRAVTKEDGKYSPGQP
jgi:hypothetical protein